MQIRFFKHGVGGKWELNFIGKVWNFRIARYQFALWKNYKQVFNYLSSHLKGTTVQKALKENGYEVK